MMSRQRGRGEVGMAFLEGLSLGHNRMTEGAGESNIVHISVTSFMLWYRDM